MESGEVDCVPLDLNERSGNGWGTFKTSTAASIDRNISQNSGKVERFIQWRCCIMTDIDSRDSGKVQQRLQNLMMMLSVD